MVVDFGLLVINGCFLKQSIKWRLSSSVSRMAGFERGTCIRLFISLSAGFIIHYCRCMSMSDALPNRLSLRRFLCFFSTPVECWGAGWTVSWTAIKKKYAPKCALFFSWKMSTTLHSISAYHATHLLAAGTIYSTSTCRPIANNLLKYPSLTVAISIGNISLSSGQLPLI